MIPSKDDPIVSSSRREAVVFALIWLTTLLYTVGYCFTHGYERPLDGALTEMKFVFGWPDWVFWGIVVPWGTCTVVSILFATLVMQDAPLGEESTSGEFDA
jgi:hypothetical protein